jgi:hypothetical protein
MDRNETQTEVEKELAALQSEWDNRRNMTPEQRRKLDAKITALSVSSWAKENPEVSQRAGKYFLDTLKFRQEAEKYLEVQNTHGMSSFLEYSRENPLSPRASIHLLILQKEADEKAHKPTAERLQAITDGYKQRADHGDKRDVAAIVQRIHEGYQTIQGIIDAPELAAYRRTYTGRDTLRRWVKAALPDRKFGQSAMIYRHPITVTVTP